MRPVPTPFGLKLLPSYSPDGRLIAYFGNAGGPRVGLEADRPETDIEGEMPRFVDEASCQLRLRPESPAIGRAEDGTNIGAF